MLRFGISDNEEDYGDKGQGRDMSKTEKIFVATCKDDEEDEEELPEVLLTKKGEKLILKRKERVPVITHKTPNIGSEAYMFLQVLLYYPHDAESQH